MTCAVNIPCAIRMESAPNVGQRSLTMSKKKKPKKFKRRIPVAPPRKRHSTKKDYKRKKKVDIERDTYDVGPIMWDSWNDY